MWAIMTSWLTPASLFLILNLMIGTIAITSRFTSNKNPQQQQQLARAPSILERVRSINFSHYKFPPSNSETLTETLTTTQTYFPTTEPEHPTRFDDQPQLERTPSLLERVKSISLSSFYRSEPVSDQVQDTGHDSGTGMDMEHHEVRRSKSEPRVVEPERKAAPEKMKKSASERAVAVDAEEEKEIEKVERRRPATARIEKTVSFGDEECVDAKADHFINKFKQQLRLQRLDSLLRYRDMLKGK